MRYFCTKISKMKLQSLHTFLLAACVFSVFSCTDNDDKIDDILPTQPTEETVLLVKKVTQTTHFGSSSETSVTNYTYEGGQLSETQTIAGANTYGSVFHYDGDKVTSVDYTQNGSADGLTTFAYNGDELLYTLSGETQDERTDYTFLNGHVATAKVYYPVGPDEELLQSVSYLYENGNVAEELRSTFWFGADATKSVYTYDDKNSPFKGMNKYLRIVIGNEGFDGLSANNPLTKTAYNPVGEATPDVFHYTIEHNAQNYATLIKRYDSNDVLISETAIEYQ